eukprot:1437958-Prymnesium_polylepis.2
MARRQCSKRSLDGSVGPPLCKRAQSVQMSLATSGTIRHCPCAIMPSTARPSGCDLINDTDLSGAKLSDFGDKVVLWTERRREWGSRAASLLAEVKDEDGRKEKLQALSNEYRGLLLDSHLDLSDVYNVKMVRTHGLLAEASAVYVASYTISKQKQAQHARADERNRQANEESELRQYGLSFPWAVAGPELKDIKAARVAERSGGYTCLVVQNRLRQLYA